MLLTLSLLPVFPPDLHFSVQSVFWGLWGVLDLERHALEAEGIAPRVPLENQRQLKALGTRDDRMLRDDVAAYATLVV